MSKTKLGAVVAQDDKPIAFFSRKLDKAQVNYTTTERELLAIVETLKEFKNILLGHKIVVHTDHQNLTYKTFNTERVMRWRLMLEEFGPEFIHIKGKKNIVADALSRLDTYDKEENLLQELFNLTKEDDVEDIFPLTYKNICLHQQQDKDLLAEMRKQNPGYAFKVFHGAESPKD